jgi:hypothetical protein
MKEDGINGNGQTGNFGKLNKQEDKREVYTHSCS